MEYHFDLDKFWRKLKQLNLGTGTLASTAGVRPDDVQMMIRLELAKGDVALKLLEVLGREVLAYDPDENEEISDQEEVNLSDDSSTNSDATVATNDIDPSGYAVNVDSSEFTINEIKAGVADGTWTLADIAASERAAEAPRSTLLAWLEEMEAKVTVNSTEV